MKPNQRDIPYRRVSHPAILTLHKVRKEFCVDIEAVLVRPGTFEALEEYLGQYGSEYFDLIHIDVHGAIEDGKYV